MRGIKHLPTCASANLEFLGKLALVHDGGMCLRTIAFLIVFSATAVAQQVQRADVGFELYYYEVPAEQPHIKMFFTCGRQDEYEIEVTYETMDGTAKAGVDFVATSGSFIFPAGSPTRTREIQVQ